MTDKLKGVPSPVGWRLLVEVEDPPLKAELESKLVRLSNEDSLIKQHYMGHTIGTIAEMGSDCYKGRFETDGDWCKAGDRVLFIKYAGQDYFNEEGKLYRLMNDEDICGNFRRE
jgi:co-chaperonin GroES (HSP10)